MAFDIWPTVTTLLDLLRPVVEAAAGLGIGFAILYALFRLIRGD